MEDIDFWRLAEELTIVQAALLVAGEDPSSSSEYVENWDAEKRPAKYEAAKHAIKNALLNDGMRVDVHHLPMRRCPHLAQK